MAADAFAMLLARSKGLAKAKPAEAVKDDDDQPVPDGLQAAAEDLLIALGQDYGSGPNAEESRRNEFRDKAKRVARAMHAAFVICESLDDE